MTPEEAASKLTPNMVRSLTWWCTDGTVNSEVDDATKRGLVRRKLGTWSSGQCVDLTELGQQVREILLAKAEAEKQAELQALADKLAAERKIRAEGYEAGAQWARDACLRQLNRAVYGCDNWPDRPHDSVWERLIDTVREQFKPWETS